MNTVPGWRFVLETCEIGLGCDLEGRDVFDCFNMCGQQVKGGDPPPVCCILETMPGTHVYL